MAASQTAMQPRIWSCSHHARKGSRRTKRLYFLTMDLSWSSLPACRNFLAISERFLNSTSRQSELMISYCCKKARFLPKTWSTSISRSLRKSTSFFRKCKNSSKHKVKLQVQEGQFRKLSLQKKCSTVAQASWGSLDKSAQKISIVMGDFRTQLHQKSKIITRWWPVSVSQMLFSFPSSQKRLSRAPMLKVNLPSLFRSSQLSWRLTCSRGQEDFQWIQTWRDQPQTQWVSSSII